MPDASTPTVATPAPAPTMDELLAYAGSFLDLSFRYMRANMPKPDPMELVNTVVTHDHFGALVKARVDGAFDEYDPTENHNFVPVVNGLIDDKLDRYDITDHRHFRNAVHAAISDYEFDDLSYGQRNEVEGMIDDAKGDCATDDHEHDELSDSQRDEVDEIARKVFKQNVDSHNHCELSADQVVQVEQIVDRMQRDVPVHYLVKMEDLAAKAALGAIDPYFVYNEVHKNEHVRNEIVSLVSAVPRLTSTEFTQMLLAALDDHVVQQRLVDFLNNNCNFLTIVEKV